MKIAVPFENGQVFQHFGHTQQFKVYEAEAGKIISSKIVETNGSGHGALAGMLSGLDVNALICGGIGAGAKEALSTAGINIYPGVTGEADKAAEALASGTLSYDSEAMCDHHHEGEGHDCGSHNHSCGGHCHN